MGNATAPGSLTIVGTGIQAGGQVTVEAQAHMEQADKLLFLVADPPRQHRLAEASAPFKGGCQADVAVRAKEAFDQRPADLGTVDEATLVEAGE